MLSAKRSSQDARIYQDDEQPPAKKNHALEFDARAPWLQDRTPRQNWRTLGDRAVQPSLPLGNMVTAVQDLIDPDFDPLIAILDDEPRFLRPLPERMSSEDLEFLRIRDALTIPESGLRNELLRCYIKWVHSFMPVLNLQKFLLAVSQNDPNGNISLLLFQAVMFVATAFVDFKHLLDAGYPTRKSARTAFYTRLRLLYSLDCEEDRIAIIQTLLLMTYWSDHANHPQRDIWDWIGVCNTQAQSIGLNRDSSAASNLDPSTKRLRTRLWWCLYSRDRLIAMGLRRPTQLNEGTSNVPMLKLEDFDFESYHPSVTGLFHCRQLEDISHQKRLATMFIEMTKLCQSIGRVLFAQYASSQCQFGNTTRTTITLIPRQASESELAKCSQRLESWLHSLPRDAQFIPASRNNFKEGEDVLLLHSAMLRMLYHATISALHRPWAGSLNKDQPKARLELTNTARAKMHHSALGITHIIQGLNQLNLTRFLPQSGVTVILPAAVAHLINCNSDDPTVRETSIYNFQRCIQVLSGLKDIYPAADMEVANIEAAVKVRSGDYNSFSRIMPDRLDSRNQGGSFQSQSGLPFEKPSKHQGSQPPEDTQSPKSPGQQQQTRKQSTTTEHRPPSTIAPEDVQAPSTPYDFDAAFNLDSNTPDLDLLTLDFNINSASFPDYTSPSPGLPGWSDELLAESRLHGSENEDPFEFDSAGHGGHETGHGRSHTPKDITGDLDRDLGLVG